MELSNEANSSQKVPPKKKRGKMLLVILLFFVITILAAAGFFYRETLSTAWQEYNTNTEIVRFQGVEVNLGDKIGNRYLRVSIVVEVQGKKAVEELGEKSYRVKDGIIKILRAKTVGELANGTEIAKLKKDILDIINGELTMGEATSVYFEEFIIQ